MKKIAFIALLCAAALGLSAQAAPSGLPAAPRDFEPSEKVSLSGTLTFVGEEPAIKTDSGTILIGMPQFYYFAYTDGLKAGMAVKASGILAKLPAEGAEGQGRLIVANITIGGKTYVVVPAMSELPRRGAPERADGQGPEGGPGPQGQTRGQSMQSPPSRDK